MTTDKGFEFNCQTSIVIDREVETVYQALFHLQDWPKLLPHVKQVNVLYDDGNYQEFTMTVLSEKDAGALRVRSVRLCDADKRQIGFFQPEPPPFLKHHAGGWQFIPLTDKQCQVITFHNWNLNHEKSADIFGQDESNYEQRVSSLLLNHANFALENWKRILETDTVANGRQS